MDTARPLAGVHGWLLFLTRLLIVWHPVRFALAAPEALQGLAVRGAPLAAGLLVRAAVTAFGVGAGLALYRARSGALPLAYTALSLSLAMDLLIFLTPVFPNNRAPGDTPFYVVASVMYHAAWIAYLARSERVRETFGA